MSEKNIKFSIIVPAYNAEATLGACLASIIAVDFPQDSYEVIIVDNDSTDQTPMIIKRYPVQYCLCKKRSQAAARNTGVFHSHGEILCFIDAKCRVPREWLKIVDEEMANGDIDVLGGPYRYDNLKNIWQEFAAREHNRDNRYSPESDLKLFYGGNLVVKRDVYFGLRGFNEVCLGADDTEFSFKAFKEGFRTKFSSNLYTFHHKREDLHELILQRRRLTFGIFRAFDTFPPELLRVYFPEFKKIPSKFFLNKKGIRKKLLVVMGELGGSFIPILCFLLSHLSRIGLKNRLYPLFLLAYDLAYLQGKALAFSKRMTEISFDLRFNKRMG